MSSHPFGLREDPFAAGFELSLEETQQLVQNRVSACGGDGAALFPPETCAEIHRRARGVASAALKLAEHAMLRAAGEGAPSVSPAHVRPEAAGSPTGAEGSSAQPPAGPSRSAMTPAAPAPHPPTPHEITATSPSPAEAAAHEPAQSAHHARSVSTPSLGRRRAGRPGSASRTTIMAVFMLFPVGAVVLILRLHPAGPAIRSLARTSAPPAATVPGGRPHHDDDSVITVYRAPLPETTTSAPSRKTPASRTATAIPAPARAESSQTESPRLGLEVARFIVPERAQVERKRLAATGYKVRVLTGWEGGAAVFRVVLGSFETLSEAERIADKLLRSGLVGQARVVTLKQRTSRSP